MNLIDMLGRRLFPALVALAAAAGIARAEPVPDFLVAKPDLGDPFFEQSVVLMLPPPAIPLIAGVIINKPTTLSVKQIFPKASGLAAPSDMVYFGGPVEPDAVLMVRRTSAPIKNERHVFADLYLTVDPNDISTLLQSKDLDRANLRLFRGYSQWGRDQLRAEKMEGSWDEVPANPELVFTSNPKQLWRQLSERARYLRVNAPYEDLPEILPCSFGFRLEPLNSR